MCSWAAAMRVFLRTVCCDVLHCVRGLEGAARPTGPTPALAQPRVPAAAGAVAGSDLTPLDDIVRGPRNAFFGMLSGPWGQTWLARG